MPEFNDILSIINSYSQPTPDDISKEIADDFRNRRIEKEMSRDDIAEKSGVAKCNIVRFEQKGLISLQNLIKLAIALGYQSEIQSIFHTPKFDTMEELIKIRKNTGKKRTHKRISKNE